MNRHFKLNEIFLSEYEMERHTDDEEDEEAALRLPGHVESGHQHNNCHLACISGYGAVSLI